MLTLALVGGLFAGTAYVGVRNVIDNHTDTPPQQKVQGGDVEAAVRRAATGDVVLRKLTTAITGGNRSSYEALIDPGSEKFAAKAMQVYKNLRALPVSSLSMRYVDDGSLSLERRKQLGGGSAWVAEVEVSWKLRDFDRQPVRMVLPMTLVTRNGTTYVASFSDRVGQNPARWKRPLWSLGAIRVGRGERSLVISTDPDVDVEAYARVVDKAIEDVSKVWRASWSRRVVLYLPGSQSQMEYVLGARQASYGQIAAVTTAETTQRMPGVPVRIVANPKLFAKLSPQGRRIVLTHETTHVASNATSSPVPLWLAEGFADYVAFSTADVSVRSAANELIKAVEAGEGPKSLPGASAFSASSKRLAVAYESGWLACRMIAEKYGRDKLVAFYRKVHTSTSKTGLRDAFKSALGTTQDEFVADWQRYLQRLADE